MMKMKNLFTVTFVFAMGFLLINCSDNTPSADAASSICFYPEDENPLHSAEGQLQSLPVSTVFTGSDILWLKESTGEIRFRNQQKIKKIFSGTHSLPIAVYIGDEYLFSLQWVSSASSALYNAPVFMLDTNGKFYIADGYPNWRAKSNQWLTVKDTRKENWKQIEPGWLRFIAQLKAEGRYRK